MIYSVTGKIVAKSDDTIAVDIGYIAYELFVSRPAEYTIGDSKTVYTYEVLTQDDHYLVGFDSLLEKAAFASLISVKGIGPKTAISALLKKLPGIGPKAAAQIILDLRGKLIDSAGKKQKGNPEIYDEVKAALKSLDFKSKDIDDALATINEPGATAQEILKLALKRLRKQ